jgi:CHAT domain-containing protein
MGLGKELFGILVRMRNKSGRSLEGVFGYQQELVLELDASSRSLPWELAFKDEFLCCRYNVGRTLPGKKAGYFSSPYGGRKRALVIGLNYEWDNELQLNCPEAEARQVTGSLRKADFRVTTLYGLDATKEKVLEELKKGVTVFHFSGHGSYLEYRKENRKVGLLLAEDERLTESDLREVFESANGAPDLAFLNACQSTPEVLGPSMVDAFVNQGVRHLIGTDWSVYDDASTEFVKRFYEDLVAGESYGESLRQARLQFKRGSTYSECATWPAFVHYGQPAESLES